MCRRKKTKFLFAFLFATFLALATFHCGNFFSIFKAKADNPFDYFDAEGYEYIDGGEVVWGKGEHIIEKGLFIQNGGTLKLDAGAKVLFRNSADTRVAIFLWGGKIIALGTQAERVTFSSTITDGIFSLSFEPDEDSEPSFFRYTDFIGTKINGEPEIYRDPSVDASSANTIVNLFNYKRGKVHIENSTFQNKGVSVDSRISENHNPTGFIEIVNSNFELENYAVAISSKLTCEQLSAIDCKKRVFLKNNWYGGSAGPREAPDYTLGNERIYGTYYLASFKRKKLISDPAIIVPGIMGSAKIGLEWELDPILHTYDNLVNSLEKNGYEAGVNLFGFGYNWENNNGTSAHYLQSRIEGIIADTRVSKVDVVAHSMGGLVARAYIEDLNSIDYENTIDQLITLGTPNAGAPKTYLHWEAGEGFFSVSDQFTKYHFQQEAKHSGYDDLFRYIQEKVPSVQELLPISNYLINAQNGSMKNYPNDYPRNSFLEELNLDSNLEKMQKVNYINIIGKLSSNNSTISNIKVIDTAIDGKWKNGMPENFYNEDTSRGLFRNYGDEVVPATSATAISANKQIEINASHQELPDAAQCEVFKELTNETKCQMVNNWHLVNVLIFNLFSPVDIQIISPSGKRMGKDFETGKILNEIEGAYYTGYDTENEFVTIPNPEPGQYKIITQGTGAGSYEIKAINLKENADGTASEQVASYKGTASLGAVETHSAQVSDGKVSDPNAGNYDNDSNTVSSNVSSNVSSSVSSNDDDNSHSKKTTRHNANPSEPAILTGVGGQASQAGLLPIDKNSVSYPNDDDNKEKSKSNIDENKQEDKKQQAKTDFSKTINKKNLLLLGVLVILVVGVGRFLL